MRLLLEGPRIEPLLARVRAEHGPAAKIVHADRIRTGGVAGFFVRERFEVVVEIDDPGPPPDDAASAREVAGPDGSATTPGAPSPTGTATAPTAPGPTGGGIDALVAAAEQAERAQQMTPATRSTALPATPAHPSVVATALPATGVLTATVPPAAAPTTPTAPAPASSEAPAPTSSEAPAPSAPATALPVPVPPAPVPAAPAQPVPAPTAPVPADRALPAAAPSTRGPRSFRDAVGAAGLPAALLDTLPADAGPTELLDALRTLPPAPRLLARAGHLVAVVGERRAAMATARRYADRLKLDPADVLVAGRPADPGDDRPEPVGDGHVLTSTDQARRASAAIRVADVPAVVVVECGHGRDEADWAVQLLRAISADQVVACVDATRKPAATRAWLRAWARPGVPVEAVSVHGATHTDDPATVLDLPVPVLDVDGLDAAPTTWLALLLDVVQPRRALTGPATRDRAATGGAPGGDA